MTETCIERRDHAGVLLRYYPGSFKHHSKQKTLPSDRERMILIAAERELHALRTIVDHTDFSDVALARIYRSLNTVQRGLEMVRGQLGLTAFRRLSS